MSPGLALQSPVFLLYLALAAGLLVGGGIVLAVLGWSLHRDVGHAWGAYRGWLLMVPLLLLVFFLGREAAIVFVSVVAALGFREFAHATGVGHDRVLAAAVYLGIAAIGVACLVSDPADGGPGWYGLFMALPAFVTAAILAIPVLRNRAEHQLRLLALAVLGFVYFGWMFGHLAFLANSSYAYSYLGYLVLAVELGDVAAYTCGKLFGRHLLRGNISPKKTWEGAAGALAVSAALPWALRFTFPHLQAIDCVLIGLVVGVGGQLGDLVASAMKRDLRVKDMGAAIPGHGGVVDRIDSLIYAAPLFFHYIRYRHQFSVSP
jgi:phosphatidate cytidylyltransferase